MAGAQTAAVLAGGVSGAISTFAVFPIDTLKLKMQTGIGLGGSVGSYYSGVLPATFGAIPSTALRMSASEHVKRSFVGRENSMEANMAAGAAGAAFSALVIVPREVVKQSLQNGKYHTVSQAVSEIMRQEGMRGFLRGTVPTLLHDVPFFMINSGVFYFMREQLNLPVLPSGIAASSLAAFLLTPIDLVRSLTLAGNSGARSGFINGLQMIVRESGYRGLFRGAGLRLATIAPMFTMIWVMYDSLRVNIERVGARSIQSFREKKSAFASSQKAAFSLGSSRRLRRRAVCA